MGFNNGYDAGWQDAINAVKYGKVPGLGPKSEDRPDPSQEPSVEMSLMDMVDALDEGKDSFVASLTSDNLDSVFTKVYNVSLAIREKADGLSIQLTALME